MLLSVVILIVIIPIFCIMITIDNDIKLMQKFKKCPHCGSAVWIIPIEEPICEACGCDTDIPAEHDEEIKSGDRRD